MKHKKHRVRFYTFLTLGIFSFLWLIKVPVLSLYLQDKLRLPISIEWMSIWPRESLIREFRIENPKGFSEKNAMKVDAITIVYKIPNLFSSVSQIEEIFLDTVTVDVEFINETVNNWTELSKNMPKPKKLHPVKIKSLIAKDLNIIIRNMEGAHYELKKHVDELKLQNLNSEKGFPTELVIQKIFGSFELEDLLKDAFDPFHLFESF